MHYSCQKNVPRQIDEVDDIENIEINKRRNFWPYPSTAIEALNDRSVAVLKREGEDDISLTAVPWTTHKLGIEREAVLDFELVDVVNDDLYGVDGDNNLYKTTDDFSSQELITQLPGSPRYNILDTPKGAFIRVSGDAVYRSEDMENWSLSYDGVEHRGLMHMFDYYYDEDSDTVYIFVAEYTTDDDERHRIYRGTITGESENWEVVQEYYAINEPEDPTIRHFHVVTTDKSTGTVWYGTGDADEHCILAYSEDFGDTWTVFQEGSQRYRVLSIWFTDDYVYWNVDATTIPQAIYRAKKSELNKNDYERAVLLDNGTHWYHTWAKDIDDNNVVIMGASIQGERRDRASRVFCIREKLNGEVDAQELESFLIPEGESHHAQLEPQAQSSAGYIYLSTRGAIEPEGMWKTKMINTRAPIVSRM